jgi:hypothetical protein
MKATRPVVAVLTLLSLLGASRAGAKLLCQDCGCALFCTTVCTTSTGSTSTCGASGARCRGKTGCGLLTAAEASGLLDLVRQAVQPAAAESRAGAAGASAPWQLTYRGCNPDKD